MLTVGRKRSTKTRRTDEPTNMSYRQWGEAPGSTRAPLPPSADRDVPNGLHARDDHRGEGIAVRADPCVPPHRQDHVVLGSQARVVADERVRRRRDGADALVLRERRAAVPRVVDVVQVLEVVRVVPTVVPPDP